MKKIISIMLVFAALASLMAVSGFAFDAGVVEEANGVFSDITNAFADLVGPITEEFNCGAGDLIFDTGFNDFLDRMDASLESFCIAIIDLVATIENLFA